MDNCVIEDAGGNGRRPRPARKTYVDLRYLCKIVAICEGLGVYQANAVTNEKNCVAMFDQAAAHNTILLNGNQRAGRGSQNAVLLSKFGPF